MHSLTAQVVKTPWKKWEVPQPIKEKGIRPKYVTSNQFRDLYLLDDENYWLVLMPADGSPPRIAGGWGDSRDLFSLPTDIMASPGLDVLVCDNASHRLLRFDRKLNFIADVPLTRIAPTPVEFPFRIDMNNLGEIVVASSGDRGLNLISSDWAFVTRMGDATYGDDRFSDIADIKVGENQEVGLVDMGTQTFYVLTRAGQVEQRIPLPSSEARVLQYWQNRWLIFTLKGSIYELSSMQSHFTQIPEQFGSEQERWIVDSTIIDDLIYAIDDLTGTIVTARLHSIE